MARDDFDGVTLMLHTSDVVGDSPLNNPKIAQVLQEIEQKVGWASIKKSIHEMMELAEKNYHRELEGLTCLPMVLNRMYLGNPGL